MYYSYNDKCPYCGHMLSHTSYQEANTNAVYDSGPNPFVFNIENAAKENTSFRTAVWTGSYLQLTLMSIEPGEEIGAEIHYTLDQFLRIEEGHGEVMIGASKDALNTTALVNAESAIIIPAGTWHNLVNTGDTPLKLYSIYAPPAHPWNTVHETKAIAEAQEEDH